MIERISLLSFGHAYQKQSLAANSSTVCCQNEVVLYTRAKEGRYLHAIAAYASAATLLSLNPLYSACAALCLVALCCVCCTVLCCEAEHCWSQVWNPQDSDDEVLVMVVRSGCCSPVSVLLLCVCAVCLFVCPFVYLSLWSIFGCIAAFCTV